MADDKHLYLLFTFFKNIQSDNVIFYKLTYYHNQVFINKYNIQFRCYYCLVITFY